MEQIIDPALFEVTVSKIIEKECAKMVEYGDKLCLHMSQDAQERLVAKSPFRRKNKNYKHYKYGWKIKTINMPGFKIRRVYNATKPGLTHIFEFGTEGRVTDHGENRGVMPKQPHIRQCFEETFQKFKNEINQL